MRKAIGIIIIVLVLANIPFLVKVDDYDAAYENGCVTYYRSLIWQYDYSCTGAHNDYSLDMRERFTLLGFITVYEDNEKMMMSDGRLVPWKAAEVKDQI